MVLDTIPSLINDLRYKTARISGRPETGLELKKTEDSLEKLYDEVYGLMIGYGENILKILKTKEILSQSDRNIAHRLIDLLEKYDNPKYKNKRSTKNLINDLKAVLAEEIGKRFP